MRGGLVSCAAMGAVLLTVHAAALSAVPQWTLDLDLPPKQRFTTAVQAVLDVHPWEHSFGAIFDSYAPFVQQAGPALGATYGTILKTRWPTQYGELQGLADAFAAAGHPEFNMTSLTFYPFFYETAHMHGDLAALLNEARACTGILSLPTDKSLPIIHGRNMDMEPGVARNLTLNITAVRGGEVAYFIFDWTWIFGGAYTGTRPGGVTLEENYNFDYPESIPAVLARIEDPANIPVAFLFRTILEAELTFEESTAFLMNASIAAPAYIITSGPGRVGHVLTLQVNKSLSVKETIDDSSAVPYMVQTNYDRWLPDPPQDPRRTVAQDALEMLGAHRSGTEWGVWMALSTFPVHNVNTVFSVLLSVAKAPEGYIRRAMIPQP